MALGYHSKHYFYIMCNQLGLLGSVINSMSGSLHDLQQDQTSYVIGMVRLGNEWNSQHDHCIRH